MTYIYALVDPRDGRVRYVGKSKDPERRLARHLYGLARNKNRHFVGWVNELLESGQRPRIRTIMQVPDANWQVWERHWIWAFRWAGEALTNLHDGGDGGPTRRGMLNSPESKSKVAAALRGRQYSQATLEKMRVAQLGKTPWNKGRQTGPASEQARANGVIAQRRRRASDTPEIRAAMAETTRQLWKNPEYRERVLNKVTGQKRGPYKKSDTGAGAS